MELGGRGLMRFGARTGCIAIRDAQLDGVQDKRLELAGAILKGLAPGPQVTITQIRHPEAAACARVGPLPAFLGTQGLGQRLGVFL
jgi:hypothetical protein